MVKENIDLTDKEKQIFDRLHQVVLRFSPKTNIRVAGGWVRDKLLGKESSDIDIALDNDMSGKEFCEIINQYLKANSEETQGMCVIRSNPDQSKHLETARMRLFDAGIDFVNLRSEDYAQNSRIPTVRSGSAEQDAYCRDLTINSLFYNLNTCLVEDLTGRGLDELKSGKIVTPLPPKETFMDDPLRVLRAIRFSARFEFEMAEDLKLAAADNDVKSAIADKISRERIGHEIDLIVTGNQPAKAMAYLSEFGLLWVVFTPPSNCISDELDKICIDKMEVAVTLMREIGCSFSDEQRRLYLYASLLLPLRKTVYNEKVPVVNHILRNSLKLKASDADDVISLHNAVEKFLKLTPFASSGQKVERQIAWEAKIINVPDPLKLRIMLGLILKEIKHLWRAALILSTVEYEHTCSVAGKLEVFKVVEREILKLGLDKVWEVKPLINGKDIITILDLEKGGPIVGEWQGKLVEWHLAYPCGSVDECVDWITRQARLERQNLVESLLLVDSHDNESGLAAHS